MVYDRILVSTEQLDACVTRIAQRLNVFYEGHEDILGLVILEGARPFATDLAKKLTFGMKLEFLKASSYKGTESTGKAKIEDRRHLPEKVEGQHILLIDDIYDTGLTLTAILEELKQYHPASMKTCVLLEKEHPHRKEVPVDFIGMKIEDAFVIGYGLDYNGLYRDLPFIAAYQE